MTGQGTIVATGSIAYPVGLGNIGGLIGAEKVMTMTSTYDHRIIQGAESGQFLQKVEAYLQGEHGFYDGVFAVAGRRARPAALAARARRRGRRRGARGRAARPRRAPSTRSCSRPCRPRRRWSRRTAPTATSPPSSTRSAPSPRATPRSTPTTSMLTPELMARIPSKILRVYVPGATLADALPHLRETYCGTIAYEIEHISSHRQRVWLREKIESGEYRKPLTKDEQQWLLGRLIKVDAFERFLHKAYLGQKQFSVEGLDMTVPMLDELIQLSAAHGAREVVMGMAHRGRLNVLAHNLGRPYDTIFAEFEGASSLEAVTTIPQGGTGDVKYHHGAQGSYTLRSGESILVNLESNPSHLEFVDPVVVGATRAAQTTRQGPHAHQDTASAVPILLHGDAAFPGQGVVSETLNLQALDGYQVGGTVHLITNNQVGFTTEPDDSRSTRWASDLAKGFDVPIIHVNADDPAACISAVRLAFAFRQEFGHDVVIDLIGYRRFGHNEADEPAYTQPEMYARIKKHPRAADRFAERLVEQGVVTKEEVEERKQQIWNELTELHQQLKQSIAAAEEDGSVEQPTGEYQLDRSRSPQVTTAVESDRLTELNEALLRTPDGFTVHPKLVKQLERRRDGARRRRRDRLVARRVAGLRLAAHRGHADPPHRPGHRARHVLPAPPRPARREDRPERLPDPEPARRARAVRAAQLAAVGDGVPRLRVRLLAGGAGDARAVGGAVRRLRQRRAGRHRPVHRQRPGQVGPDLAPDAAAARTATRARAPSTRARGSSAGSSSPPRATSASRT